MIFALDVDGVFANFVPAMNFHLNQVGPVTLRLGFEPKEYDWKRRRGTKNCPNVSDKQFKAAFANALRETNFWEGLLPYEENVNQLTMNLRDDDVLYFVTNRADTPGGTALTQTTYWLNAHVLRPFQPISFSVIVAKSSQRKALAVRAVDADVSLDDYHANVRRLITVKGHRAFLLDRPWNRSATDLNRYRVKSVDEFFEKARGNWLSQG